MLITWWFFFFFAQAARICSSENCNHFPRCVSPNSQKPEKDIGFELNFEITSDATSALPCNCHLQQCLLHILHARRPACRLKPALPRQIFQPDRSKYSDVERRRRPNISHANSYTTHQSAILTTSWPTQNSTRYVYTQTIGKRLASCGKARPKTAHTLN